MRKLKIFFITVVCLLASNVAFTLGVGDIVVTTGLSEPLDAEIKLYSVRPGEGENIRVQLATFKEFAEAGIDRPLELSFLKFKVIERGDGSAYIKVFSKRPIREPFLNFLVDIDWPSGRLLREYTLLLDPPIFAQLKAAPVQTPVVAAPARVIRQQPTPVEAPITEDTFVADTDGLFPHIQIDIAPTAVIDVPATTTVAVDRYKVKKAETLWSIAEKMLPNSSIGVSQMMLALQKANPNAFSNNNINELKSGVVLRMPTLADIQAIDRADAVRQTQQQHTVWRAAQDNLSGVVTPSGATSTKQQLTTSKQQQASVKLVTPDVNVGAAAAQGSGTDSDGKLALAAEQIESKGKENDELRDRLNSLQDQIGSMERLLELKDDSISELQDKLTVDSSTSVPAPIAEMIPEPVVAEEAAEPVVENESKINPFALDNIPQPMVKPEVVPAPAPKQPTETSLFDDPIIIAVILAVLVAVLALVWLVMKRRQNNMQLPESILSSKPVTVSTANKTTDSTTLLSDFAPSAMDGALESDPSEVDPSAEADVYIAYGKHQQAEELLLTAIKEEPDRLDLRLKLMEVYHATGNADSFLVHASHLNAAMDDQNTALWDKAVVMGRELCPGNVLFGNDAAVDEDDFADLKGIADIDDDLDLEVDVDDKPATSTNDELSLDMDIDLEALDVSGEDDDLSLDLDELSLEIEDDVKETTAKPETAVDFGELTLDVDDALADADVDSGEDAMLGMDEVATKLDLAKAYIDMGDPDGARAILDEVLVEGNDTQQSEAKGLIDQL